MGLTELSADLRDKEFSPFILHVFLNAFIVLLLDVSHVCESQWQVEETAIGLHEALGEEFDAFLRENSGQVCHVCIAAPVDLENFALVVKEVVLGASDNTKVG